MSNFHMTLTISLVFALNDKSTQWTDYSVFTDLLYNIKQVNYTNYCILIVINYIWAVQLITNVQNINE